MRRRVGIGIRLKIDDELVGPVALNGALHAFDHLFAQVGFLPRYTRRKGIDITIGTAAVTLRAIAVGTGKAPIHNYLEHALPVIFFAQPRPVIVIAFDALL